MSIPKSVLTGTPIAYKSGKTFIAPTKIEIGYLSNHDIANNMGPQLA